MVVVAISAELLTHSSGVACGSGRVAMIQLKMAFQVHDVLELPIKCMVVPVGGKPRYTITGH